MAKDVQIADERCERMRKQGKTMESIVELLEGFTFAEVLNILDSVKYQCSTLSIVGMHVKQKGLKVIREQKGMTAKQLSKLSGVSRQYIGYIEKGKVKKPRSSTLSAIATALHCNVSDIWEEE